MTTQTSDRASKIYALHIGDTKVSYGQFYGGTEGWSGYTLRHLAIDQVRPITLGKRSQKQQIASMRRIRRLRQALPKTIVAPAHDHTTYGSDHLEPFLADGDLSLEERGALNGYEARLFDDAGCLTPGAVPRYLPSPETPG